MWRAVEQCCGQASMERQAEVAGQARLVAGLALALAGAGRRERRGGSGRRRAGACSEGIEETAAALNMERALLRKRRLRGAQVVIVEAAARWLKIGPRRVRQH